MQLSTLTLGKPGHEPPEPRTYAIVLDDAQETPAANRDWDAIKTALGAVVDEIAGNPPADLQAIGLIVTLDECGEHFFELQLTPPPRRIARIVVAPPPAGRIARVVALPRTEGAAQ